MSVDRLDGTVSLYGPAPQSLVNVEEVRTRLFVCVMKASSASDIEGRMDREVKFDPDLWWIEIADRTDRLFIDVAGEEPGAAH